MAEIANNHQKLTERPGTDSLSPPSEKANPDDTLSPDFWSLFRPRSLWDFVTVALGN